MKRYEGYALAPGFARGRAWLLSPVMHRVVPRRVVPEDARDAEVARLEAAVQDSRNDLVALKARLAAEVSASETGVIDGHIAMVEDPVFLENVRRRIRELGVNTEQAVSDEIDATVALFARLDNAYLRERTDDLRDVGRRLVDALMGPQERAATVEVPANSIVVAREVLPSQAAEMDRLRVAGIVTETGGSSSHAAILARALGIPFVSGIENVLQLIPQGTTVLVDAEQGEVVCKPVAAESRGFNQRRDRYDRFLASARLEEEQPSETIDGVAVDLWGNVASAAEADSAVEHHLAGIGLLRTEFVFMNAEQPPGVSTQHRAYRRIIERVGEAPVTIRCMDLGGDKIPHFLSAPTGVGHVSPARGLRFALEHPAALLKQVRAIMRCASEGQVRILLPMVAGGDDFERALDLIDRAASKEGVGTRPPVGAMIETPAAIFEIEAILDSADFISVGSNDLTQYMLAVDRTASDGEGHYSVLYPGVLRAIKHLAVAASGANRPISICGEAAGHPLIAALFVGLGLRELSMSPQRAAAVRHVIRASRLPDLEQLAAETLAARGVRTIRSMLDERLKPLLLGNDSPAEESGEG